MKRRLIGGFALAMVACGGSGATATAPLPPDPAAAFAGTWNLSTVNGDAMPVQLHLTGGSIGDVTESIYRRSLSLDTRTKQAAWSDSTVWTTCTGGQATCSASGSATALRYSVSGNGDTLTVVRDAGISLVLGYVPAVQVFVRQSDGTLLNTGEWQPALTVREAYRRQ